MGRHTGPVEKLSRREGVELFLKGERALNGKSALERRGRPPPGQHGATAGRASHRSTRRSCAPSRPRSATTASASGSSAATSRPRTARARASPARSCCGCSSAGWTTSSTGSASPARAPRPASSSTTATCTSTAARWTSPRSWSSPATDHDQRAGPRVAVGGTELTGVVAGWLQTDFDALEGKVLRLPERTEINAPVNEQLIVELYSRL